MNILDRYIIRRILALTALVLAVVLALALLFTYIGEQGDTGTGHYTALESFWYSLMSLPQQAWELMPIAALIGSLLGLGTLASASELTVARAAGVSVARIGLAVFAAGLLLVGLEVVLGEFVAPPMQLAARQQKAFDRFNNASLGGGAAWVRDGNLILDVQQSQDGSRLGGMLVFELSDDHHLESIGRAARAVPAGNRSWQLHDYAESRFGGDSVTADSQDMRPLESNVSGQFLQLAMAEPRDLTTAALYSLISYDQQNELDAKPYLFAFWSRIARTAAIAFAVLLALPFVTGSLRSSAHGVRLLIGLLLGIGFFFLQRLIESGTVVFNLNPALLAWLPTALLVTVTLGLLARTR